MFLFFEVPTQRVRNAEMHAQNTVVACLEQHKENIADLRH